MIFSTASALFCSRHWKIALCSESTGTMMALQRVTSRITTAPAETRRLLVGEADDGAALDRRQRGLQARRPDDRRHHPFGGPRRRLDHGRTARGDFDAGTGQGRLHGLDMRLVADRDVARAQRLGLLDQQGCIVLRGQRLDRIGGRIAGDDIDGVAPDRAGRAQDGDAARLRRRLEGLSRHHASTLPPAHKFMTNTATATASRPSTRSNTPPWPGMIWLVSLTPKCRLNANSTRSPPCSKRPRTALIKVNIHTLV